MTKAVMVTTSERRRNNPVASATTKPPSASSRITAEWFSAGGAIRAAPTSSIRTRTTAPHRIMPVICTTPGPAPATTREPTKSR